jgi:hypothetical protein
VAIRTGDYYRLLKLDRQANREAIDTALWRYQSAIGNGPDSDVGTIIHAEATRVLLDESERKRYDEHLREVELGTRRPESWPTPWAYAVDLSIPHTVPTVKDKRCTRCAGTPARRATIPRLYTPHIVRILDNYDKGVSNTVQHCNSCGTVAAQNQAKAEVVKVVLLLAIALGLGIFVSPTLGLAVAFFPLVLVLGILSAWLRFRAQSPSSGRLPSFIPRD